METFFLEGQKILITITLTNVLFCPDADHTTASSHGLQLMRNMGFLNERRHLWLTDPTTENRYIIESSTGDHLSWGSSDLRPHKKEMPHKTGGHPRDEQDKIHLPFGKKTLWNSHLLREQVSLEALRSLKRLETSELGESKEDRVPFASTECVKGQTLLQLHNKYYYLTKRSSGESIWRHEADHGQQRDENLHHYPRRRIHKGP